MNHKELEKLSQSYHSIVHIMHKQEDDLLWRVNDVCLVCGDVGYPEHLISCSKCKRNKEHRYCMKVISLSNKAERSWICQECMSSDGSLDDVPLGAIFPLKKKFTNVKKDASSTMNNANFHPDKFVAVDELRKDNPQVIEKKASLQEVKRRMTNGSELKNELDLIVPREADDTMKISARLMKSEADVKRKGKAVVSDSSDDEMMTNGQPTREHNYHGKADSEGSFNMWLDDTMEVEAEAVTSSSNFSFDVMLVSHEDDSCKDASVVAEVSLVNNNVALSDNDALVSANEDIGEKNAIGRRASNDVCGETSLLKSRDHGICPISRNRTNGQGREKFSSVGNDFALPTNNAVENLSAKILRENTSLPSRELYDAYGHAVPVKTREDRNDNGNRPEKTNLARRSSYDTCGGTSSNKPRENGNNCYISDGRTNENAANNHEHVVANYDEKGDSRPVDEINWRGYFSFGDFNYGVMHAHLTTSSYHVLQVNEEVKKLNRVLRLEKVPNRIAWPSRFYTSSSPNENDIALYFFPRIESDEGWYDALVRELREKDVTYRAILDCSELLIFPSSLLPDYYEKFSGRRYLWGSFRRRQADQPKPTNGDLPYHKGNNENPARIGSNSNPLERKPTNGDLPYFKRSNENSARIGSNSNPLERKPTNGDLPCYKRSNENPVRVGSNSNPLERNADNVTHASTNGDLPYNKRSNENPARSGSNSSPLERKAINVTHASTNGDLPYYKRSNDNPARIGNNSNPLERNAINVTHASTNGYLPYHKRNDENPARIGGNSSPLERKPTNGDLPYYKRSNENPVRIGGSNSNPLERKPTNGNLPHYKRSNENPVRIGGGNLNPLERKSTNGDLPHYKRNNENPVRIGGSNSNPLERKPTNGDLPYLKRSNEKPARIGSNCNPLKRKAVTVTHASLSHEKKTETALFPKRRASQQKTSGTGVFPDRKAGENSNSLELMSGRLPNNNVVDRPMKSGFDSSTTRRGSRVNNKDKSLLKLFPLQLENIAVVSKT